MNSIQASHLDPVQAPVEMTFAKVLGIDSVNVSAKAKAMPVPLKSSKKVTPIAVEKESDS